MKRLLLISLISLLGFCVNQSFAQSVKTGAKAGVNFANFYDGGSSTDARTGFQIGGFVKMDFPMSPVSVQPEIYYAQKGAENSSGEIKLEYIEVPILVKIGLAGPGPVQPNLFAGPYAGINLQQNSGTSFFGGGGNQAEEVDFGGVVGAGLDFEAGSSIFTIDVRYGFGLTPVFDSGDAKNSVFAVTAGISLPGK